MKFNTDRTNARTPHAETENVNTIRLLMAMMNKT